MAAPFVTSIAFAFIYEKFALHRAMPDGYLGIALPFAFMLAPSFALLLTLPNRRSRIRSLIAMAFLSVPLVPALWFFTLFAACYIFHNCL